MLVRTLVLAWCLALCGAGGASGQTASSNATQDPRSDATRRLTAPHTYAFSYDEQGVSGPGADVMKENARNAQFVMIGESHNERETPRFALGLYRSLGRWYGFDRFAVEIDPIASEAINEAAGDLGAVVRIAQNNTNHIGFDSDNDLRLFAAVAEASRPGQPALWGIEQAQGTARYLEELVSLAPSEAVREQTTSLLSEARQKDEYRELGFTHDDPTTLGRLQALREAWRPAPESRAARLLNDLITSVEIYSFNRRASSEPVGWYNSSVREDLFRRNFMRFYRDDVRHGRLPRVMFKMGNLHIYRGKNPIQQMAVGNFAHEVAAYNDMSAMGIAVFTFGETEGGYEALPTWIKPLLPDIAPSTPIYVDLRPLHPRSHDMYGSLEGHDVGRLNLILMGFDGLVVLPGNESGEWSLTGFTQPWSRTGGGI